MTESVIDSELFPKFFLELSPLYLTPPHSSKVYPMLQTNFYEPEPLAPNDPCKSRSRFKTSAQAGFLLVDGAGSGVQAARSIKSFVHSRTTLACPSFINLERPISQNLTLSNELAWKTSGLQLSAQPYFETQTTRYDGVRAAAAVFQLQLASRSLKQNSGLATPLASVMVKNYMSFGKSEQFSEIYSLFPTSQLQSKTSGVPQAAATEQAFTVTPSSG